MYQDIYLADSDFATNMQKGGFFVDDQKDEVAELYKSFGMTIFHDMLPRAKKAHELDELLRNAQREVQRIQEEIEELSCPTLRIE